MNSIGETKWTPDRENTLRTLIAAGVAFSAIAAQLGGGFTRNAAIAKAHRLGLTNAKPVAVDGEHDEPAARKSRKAPERPAPSMPKVASERGESKTRQRRNKPLSFITAPDETKRVTLLNLGNGCKWPIGDPRDPDFCFCGCTKESSEGVYCEFHARMAYTVHSKAKPRIAEPCV